MEASKAEPSQHYCVLSLLLSPLSSIFYFITNFYILSIVLSPNAPHQM
jgi:hypothetical protein